MVRKVLVTGANKGLGFEVCKKLLEIPDMYVIVGSRDQGRGEEALKALAELPGSEGRLELTLIDVGDQDSIKKAADAYGAKHGPNSLYCLVNNAGLSSRSPGKEVWAVNAGNIPLSSCAISGADTESAPVRRSDLLHRCVPAVHGGRWASVERFFGGGADVLEEPERGGPAKARERPQSVHHVYHTCN
eukprot:1777060-Rhodomonas_salina.2